MEVSGTVKSTWISVKYWAFFLIGPPILKRKTTCSQPGAILVGEIIRRAALFVCLEFSFSVRKMLRANQKITLPVASPEFYLMCGFSVVGEEDALMRRTGLGHGYGGGTSCLVKGSYCRCNTLSLFVLLIQYSFLNDLFSCCSISTPFSMNPFHAFQSVLLSH